ncbi:2OG-Fe(II) oxygenase [Balneatrix alpica]|uniref:2OG-Fe(II) oxygenase n=1 Tax=Balneatrix alpica TaxID=75684 RepID=A0ABV5ZEB7_9GAMM|nr:2OG-Fe(II) oxygenase [Balneatrix alpica]
MECIKSWNEYFCLLRRCVTDCSSKSEFKERGFYTDYLDRSSVELLKEQVDKLNGVKFCSWDHLENYSFNNLDWMGRGYVNKNFSFKLLSEEFCWHLSDVLESMQPLVSQQIGHNFSIVSTRVWEQYPQPQRSQDSYSLGWHTDDFPENFYKILIYLTELNELSGTTKLRVKGQEISLVGVQPGRWVLFDPTAIVHKGEPPVTKGELRATIEITIRPSFVNDLRVLDSGVNSKIPIYPWSARSSAVLAKRKHCIYSLEKESAVSGFLGDDMKRVEVFGGGPQEYFNKIHALISYLNSKDKVWVYGLGSVAKIFLPHIVEKVEEVVDVGMATKMCKEIGKTVLPADDMLRSTDKNRVIFVTPIGRKKEISALLENVICQEVVYAEDFL